MTTIRETLSQYAHSYQEAPNQTLPLLTKKDFLASMAKNKNMEHCEGMRCLFNEAHSFDAHQDLYIDLALGEASSVKRDKYEKYAAQLFQTALRFAQPDLLDTSDENLQQEMSKIEAALKAELNGL